MNKSCLWVGKLTVFFLLFGVAALLGVNGDAEPMGPHFIPLPPPTLEPVAPEPPEFRNRTPQSTSPLSEAPSMISIQVVSRDIVVTESSIRMWVDGCVPDNAGPGRTYFSRDHEGVSLIRLNPFEDFGFREITFILNLTQVGCELPDGEIEVQVYATAGVTVFTSSSTSWSFTIDEPARPILPRLQGPTITSISPTASAYGEMVVVSGTGFQDSIALNRFRGSQVLFNGEPAETEFVSTEKLRFRVPDAPCGEHTIHVRNRGIIDLGEERNLSNGMAFKIPVLTCVNKVFEPPVINSLSNNSAPPNTEVTVFGHNFTPSPFGFTRFGSKVKLDNIIARTSVVSDKQLSFTVPDNVCGLMTLWVENIFSTGATQSNFVEFTIPCEIAPSVRIEFEPQDPRETDTLTFNVFDVGFRPENGPVVYHWFLNPEPGELDNLNNFGDAAQCDQPCTEVTLDAPAPGLYNVFVRAMNGIPEVATANTSVRVSQANGNFVPDVAITMTPITPEQGAVFSAIFTIESSDADGGLLNPLNFEWFGNDLNDGQPEFRLRRGNGDFVNGDENTISFQNNGEYTIRVVVPDGQGGIGEASIEFSIPLDGSGPAPSPPGPSLPEALDTDTDSVLDDEEILEAIRLWALGSPVAGANQTINDCLMIELIRLWAADVNIRNIRAFVCSGTR